MLTCGIIMGCCAVLAAVALVLEIAAKDFQTSLLLGVITGIIGVGAAIMITLGVV